MKIYWHSFVHGNDPKRTLKESIVILKLGNVSNNPSLCFDSESKTFLLLKAQIWAIRIFRSQEQELEKQRLLFHQARLASRGVAEMALLYISACKGTTACSRILQRRYCGWALPEPLNRLLLACRQFIPPIFLRAPPFCCIMQSDSSFSVFSVWEFFRMKLHRRGGSEREGYS